MRTSNWFKVRRAIGLTLFWGGVTAGFTIMIVNKPDTLGSICLDVALLSTVPIGFIFWTSTWN